MISPVDQEIRPIQSHSARRSSSNVIKIDGMLQSCFRLLHVARDTGVAGEVKSNQGILGMQRTRFEKDCLRG
jgi:hypothetical protein